MFKLTDKSHYNMKIFTEIFDYVWLLSFFWIINCYIDSNLTPFKASMTLGVFLFAFLRDIMFMVLYPDKISKDKIKFTPDMKLFISFWKDTIFFGGSLAFLTYCKLIYWETMFTNLNSSIKIIGQIYLDTYILIISKELQLEFFHKSMHENNNILSKFFNKKLKQIHKLHHTTKTNLWTLNAFYVEIPDSIMESLAAPFVLFGFKYYMGHQLHLHLGSFLMFVIFDLHCHSANPYTQALYNPILDYFLKPTISHSLHHTFPATNYRQIPLHHFSYEKRIEDLNKYNKVHKTNFVL
jgi:hypothetical protein